MAPNWNCNKDCKKILHNANTNFNIVKNQTSTLVHEATISQIDEEKLFYLMSKGISKERAREIIVMGFINDFTKELPMEYTIELNRLISHEMKNSIG